MFLGKAHDLLCISIADKVGLGLVCEPMSQWGVMGNKGPGGEGGVGAQRRQGSVGRGTATATERTYLLGGVHEGVTNIPFGPVADNKTPWHLRPVQVDQKADGEIAQLHLFMVEARARHLKVGGKTRQQQCEIAKARDSRDEGSGMLRGVRDVQGNLHAP